MNGKNDCERLMNVVLPLAERMLSKLKEFYPYGAYMRPSGEIVDVGVEEEGLDHPKSRDLLYVLRESFSEMARTGACKATAIVTNVVVTLPGGQNKSDAIQISLEHEDCYSAEVFVPYAMDGEGKITYGDMFAQQGDKDIFG
ncbi:MAG: hypothetical protein LAO09_06565 [Acidobacteriia bacterium]|nr:hypothetical protein [Terriglobia bacterium]